MHRAVGFASFMMVLGAHAAAEETYSPPPVGTMVTWSFGNEDARETRISLVVATGDDFAIYLSDLRLDDETPSSYIVEFSGIHVASCAGKMPTRRERDGLASAWPLTSGDIVEMSGTMAATYTIGKLTSHTLNVAEGPTQARHIKASYGGVENDITFSLNWNMPVAIGWPDGTGDRALEVLPPDGAAGIRRDLRSALGNCAALLDN